MTAPYNQLPYIYGQNVDALREVLRDGQSRIVRAAMLSDSRIARNTVSWLGHLNMKFASVFGGCPEGQFQGGAVDSNNPTFSTGGVAVAIVSSPSTDPTWYPPNGAGLILPNHSNAPNYGGLIGSFCPDNNPQGATQPTIAHLQNLATPGGNAVPVEIFGQTASGSGEIHWDGLIGGPVPNIFIGPSASGATTLGLNSSILQVKSQIISMTLAGNSGYTYANLQVYLSSADTANFAIGLGYRCRSNTVTAGVVVDGSMSVAGWTSGSFMASSANCWPHFLARGYDLIVACYGINDANLAGNSKATFKANISALLTAIRTNLGASYPVVFCGDFYSSAIISSQLALLRSYPEALYEIAQVDPYVTFVNTMRITEDRGFNPSQATQGTGAATTYQTDGIHFTDAGSQLAADAIVSQLVGTPNSLADPVTTALIGLGYSSTRAANLDNLNAAITSRATPGSQMDLVNAPNATAVTAIQAGLSRPGTAQTIAPADTAAAATAQATIAANLNATVASRSTYAGGAADANAAAIKAKTDTIGTNAADSPNALAAQVTAATLALRLPGTVQPQSGDAFARLGAPAGASLAADVAAVKSDTAAISAVKPANAPAVDTSGRVTLAPAQSFNNTGQTSPLPATPAGTGNVAVNHNTGGADNLTFMVLGAGIDGADVRAYLQSDYAVGNVGRGYVKGQTVTGPVAGASGRMPNPMYLGAGNVYTIVFNKIGYLETSVQTIAI